MKTKREDLIGLGHTKLGFFKEVQTKIAELQKSNLELEHKRRQVRAILDGITDIVAVVALDYRIQTINHSFYKIYTTTDPVNAFCHEVFRQRSEPCPNCPLRDAHQHHRVCSQNAIFDDEASIRRLAEKELGSDKTIVARSIHDLSSRRKMQLVTKNCATLQKDLVRSELFGHRKGAFTGADQSRNGLLTVANKGTLFLDES